MSPAHLYLLASPDFPAAQVAIWRAAFESMWADGTVSRVYKQNNIETK